MYPVKQLLGILRILGILRSKRRAMCSCVLPSVLICLMLQRTEGLIPWAGLHRVGSEGCGEMRTWWGGGEALYAGPLPGGQL